MQVDSMTREGLRSADLLVVQPAGRRSALGVKDSRTTSAHSTGAQATSRPSLVVEVDADAELARR